MGKRVWWMLNLVTFVHFICLVSATARPFPNDAQGLTPHSLQAGWVSKQVELQYLYDYAGITTSIGFTANPVINFAGVLGNPSLAAGADVSFDTATGNFTKYNMGLSYTKSDLIAAMTLGKFNKGDIQHSKEESWDSQYGGLGNSHVNRGRHSLVHQAAGPSLVLCTHLLSSHCFWHGPTCCHPWL